MGLDEWEASWIPAKPGAREREEEEMREQEGMRRCESLDCPYTHSHTSGWCGYKGLGRPTRDVDGFWEYGVWDQVEGTIVGRGTKELATRRMETLGPRGEDPRYVLVRRWLGGWEAGD